jgi:hypothetical protein
LKPLAALFRLETVGPVIAKAASQRSPLPASCRPVRRSPPARVRAISAGEGRSRNSMPLVEVASAMPTSGAKAPTRSRIGSRPAYSTHSSWILPASSEPVPPKS